MSETTGWVTVLHGDGPGGKRRVRCTLTDLEGNKTPLAESRRILDLDRKKVIVVDGNLTEA
jgi:hypothetical protein